MPIIEVKVPQLSESVAEATLLQWKKKPGDAVAADEILIEVETDKVVLEVPAPVAGVLAEVVVASGGTVVADQLIARMQAEAQWPGASQVITIDGVRVEYPDGFGLCRASNTTPVLVLRFEAENDAALARIQRAIGDAITRIKPEAQLPF